MPPIPAESPLPPFLRLPDEMIEYIASFLPAVKYPRDREDEVTGLSLQKLASTNRQLRAIVSPLSWKRIVLTRCSRRAPELRHHLERYGRFVRAIHVEYVAKRGEIKNEPNDLVTTVASWLPYCRELVELDFRLHSDQDCDPRPVLRRLASMSPCLERLHLAGFRWSTARLEAFDSKEYDGSRALSLRILAADDWASLRKSLGGSLTSLAFVEFVQSPTIVNALVFRNLRKVDFGASLDSVSFTGLFAPLTPIEQITLRQSEDALIADVQVFVARQPKQTVKRITVTEPRGYAGFADERSFRYFFYRRLWKSERDEAIEVRHLAFVAEGRQKLQECREWAQSHGIVLNADAHERALRDDHGWSISLNIPSRCSV